MLFQRDSAAMHIQRVVRGMFARREARLRRAAIDAHRAMVAKEEAKRLDAEQKKRAQELERKMYPRTAKDFDVLYTELEGMHDVVICRHHQGGDGRK